MDPASKDDLAARLERLESVQQVMRIKHRYGELADRLAQRVDAEDIRALGELFTEDVFVDFVSVQLPNRQAVLDLYGGGMQKQFSWVWHSFHSPIVDVDGDRASGRWTLQGMTISHGDPAPVTVYGRYNDEFVRTAQGWRMSRMQLILGTAGPQPELKRS